MVVHEAVRKAPPPLPPDDATEQVQIAPPVGIVEEHRLPRVATRVDVVNGTRNVFTRPARHALLRAPEPNFAPHRGSDPLSGGDSRGLTPGAVKGGSDPLSGGDSRGLTPPGACRRSRRLKGKGGSDPLSGGGSRGLTPPGACRRSRRLRGPGAQRAELRPAVFRLERVLRSPGRRRGRHVLGPEPLVEGPRAMVVRHDAQRQGRAATGAELGGQMREQRGSDALSALARQYVQRDEQRFAWPSRTVQAAKPTMCTRIATRTTPSASSICRASAAVCRGASRNGARTAGGTRVG